MSTTIPVQAQAVSAGVPGRIRGLQCRECGELYALEARHVCELCFGPLEVAFDYDLIRSTLSREAIERGHQQCECVDEARNQLV